MLLNGPDNPKTTPFRGKSRPPSNTRFLGPTWVSPPNGISIDRTVFAQYIRVTENDISTLCLSSFLNNNNINKSVTRSPSSRSYAPVCFMQKNSHQQHNKSTLIALHIRQMFAKRLSVPVMLRCLLCKEYWSWHRDHVMVLNHSCMFYYYPLQMWQWLLFDC